MREAPRLLVGCYDERIRHERVLRAGIEKRVLCMLALVSA